MDGTRRMDDLHGYEENNSQGKLQKIKVVRSINYQFILLFGWREWWRKFDNDNEKFVLVLLQHSINIKVCFVYFSLNETKDCHFSNEDSEYLVREQRGWHKKKWFDWRKIYKGHKGFQKVCHHIVINLSKI